MNPRPQLLLLAALAPACLLHAAPALAQDCVSFESPQPGGMIETLEIDEASGLAASRASPGVLWTHNDSGDSARLFALDTTGRLLGTFMVAGAQARDWEDIALGRCGERDCLYIGDIGNNSKNRDDLGIYRIEEPLFDVEQARRAPLTQVTEQAEFMGISYPYSEGIDDDNANAETLMVDADGVLYVVTKEDRRARLLRATFEADADVVLEHVGENTLTVATGGDWRPDGARFAVRTYAKVFEFDLTGAPLSEVFAMPARERRLRGEIQGESLGYAWDSSGFYTLSEGEQQELYHYACPANPAEDMGADMASSPQDMGADMGAVAVDMASMSAPDMRREDMAHGSPEEMGVASDMSDVPVLMDGDDGKMDGSSGCSCGTLPGQVPLSPARGLSALLLLGVALTRARRRAPTC